MDNLYTVNSAVVIFCILVSVIILFYVMINETKKEEQSKVFISIILVNILMLVSYQIRTFYDGHPNPSYNSLLMWKATVYQVCTQVLLLLHIRITLLFIKRRTTVSKLTRLAGSIAAAAVGINLLLSAVTPFTNVYFYFDENNPLLNFVHAF